jgi:hypothetical protein
MEDVFGALVFLSSDFLRKNSLEELIYTGGEYAPTFPVTGVQINSKEVLRGQ